LVFVSTVLPVFPKWNWLRAEQQHFCPIQDGWMMNHTRRLSPKSRKVREQEETATTHQSSGGRPSGKKKASPKGGRTAAKRSKNVPSTQGNRTRRTATLPKRQTSPTMEDDISGGFPTISCPRLHKWPLDDENS
jgi:hypothetical protein